jgi:hypothetical protein
VVTDEVKNSPASWRCRRHSSGKDLKCQTCRAPDSSLSQSGGPVKRLPAIQTAGRLAQRGGPRLMQGLCSILTDLTFPHVQHLRQAMNEETCAAAFQAAGAD